MVKRGPCVRPQASEGEAQHGPFCWNGRFGQGDSVCIVDDTGRIVREVKVASEPEALLAVLTNPAFRFTPVSDTAMLAWCHQQTFGSASYRGGCVVGFHSRASFCASAICDGVI